MPSVALGYASYGQSTFLAGEDGVQRETVPGTRTIFTLMAGLKFLVSHHSGFYAGVGYDFIYTRSATVSTAGTGSAAVETQSLDTTGQHQIAINIGFSFHVGWLRFRPEIAFAAQPSITTGHADKDNSYGAYGGYGFVIMPLLSVAAETPVVVTRDTAADEDEQNLRPPPEDEQVPESREEREQRKKHRDDDRDDGT